MEGKERRERNKGQKRGKKGKRSKGKEKIPRKIKIIEDNVYEYIKSFHCSWGEYLFFNMSAYSIPVDAAFELQI